VGGGGGGGGGGDEGNGKGGGGWEECLGAGGGVQLFNRIPALTVMMGQCGHYLEHSISSGWTTMRRLAIFRDGAPSSETEAATRWPSRFFLTAPGT